MERKPQGRPPVVRDGIYQELRGRIVSGHHRPAGRLPTRRQLCAEFGVSTATIQAVVEHLIRDGFVEARGARGTFVNTSPPHLTRYALVFPAPCDQNRFWMALNNEALRLRHSQGVDLTIYQSIDGNPRRPGYRQLVADVRHHRVAGLIFASVPFLVKGTPLLDEPGIPRAAIGTGNLSEFNCVCVGADDRGLVRKCGDILLRHGRRKVAILLPGPGGKSEQEYLEELGLAGFSIPSWWVQAVDPAHCEAARNLAHLLARGVNGDRPDALIIADDNLVEAATEGLVDAGVRVPEDLLVLAHCNFPWPSPSLTPVIRYGYDAREFMACCIASIDAQRQGVGERTIQRVKAVVEEHADACGEAAAHTGSVH